MGLRGLECIKARDITDGHLTSMSILDMTLVHVGVPLPGVS